MNSGTMKAFFKNYKYQAVPELPRINSEEYVSEDNGTTPEKNGEGKYLEVQKKIDEYKYNFHKMPKKLIRQISEIAFYRPGRPEDRKNCFYEQQNFFDIYLEALLSSKKHYTIRTLLHNILYHRESITDYDQRIISKIKQFFENNIEKNVSRKIVASSQKFFHLENDNLKKMVLKFLKSEEKIWQNEHWPLTGLNFFGELKNRFLDAASRSVGSEKDVKVLLSYLDDMTKNHPTFSIKLNVIDTLFLPFKKNSSIDDENFRQKVEAISEYFIQDPRLNSVQWDEIPESKEIMIRWKIQRTLENFFDLLDYIAQTDEDANRMWERRKKFIETYYQHGHISGAWFVLGRNAYSMRDKFLKPEEKGYGKIISKNVESKHSVLLLKIGDFVISEWSHNGRVRGWQHGSPSCPSLYELEYFANDLRNSSSVFDFIHSGNWESRLSQEIYNKTGINLRKHF